RCIRIGGGAATPCSRVIGVVGDVRRFRIEEEPHFQTYVPFARASTYMRRSTAVLARVAGRPADIGEPVPRARYAVEPSPRYVGAVPFDAPLHPQRRPWKLGARLFVRCGGLALLIALVGMYSVIAYLVQHRTH